MRVRTNLEHDQLERVAKGLRKLADKKRTDDVPSLCNPAETALMANATSSFSQMISSLNEEVSSILIGE